MSETLNISQIGGGYYVKGLFHWILGVVDSIYSFGTDKTVNKYAKYLKKMHLINVAVNFIQNFFLALTCNNPDQGFFYSGRSIFTYHFLVFMRLLPCTSEDLPSYLRQQ